VRANAASSLGFPELARIHRALACSDPFSSLATRRISSSLSENPSFPRASRAASRSLALGSKKASRILVMYSTALELSFICPCQNAPNPDAIFGPCSLKFLQEDVHCFRNKTIGKRASAARTLFQSPESLSPNRKTSRALLLSSLLGC
jgi:hypothetical protein